MLEVWVLHSKTFLAISYNSPQEGCLSDVGIDIKVSRIEDAFIADTFIEDGFVADTSIEDAFIADAFSECEFDKDKVYKTADNSFFYLRTYSTRLFLLIMQK